MTFRRSRPRRSWLAVRSTWAGSRLRLGRWAGEQGKRGELPVESADGVGAVGGELGAELAQAFGAVAEAGLGGGGDGRAGVMARLVELSAAEHGGGEVEEDQRALLGCC